ncbi:unnamed protein product [Penicillium roqueforti FM164]|uniref:Uncharacterized protein n=1 Tax=Penicillium roqueforti (strain FM164) TaxID=1365484 RepID=W6QNM5_PENRF|nr:unnamed protein product [Penicillium roqueforti FM164]
MTTKQITRDDHKYHGWMPTVAPDKITSLRFRYERRLVGCDSENLPGAYDGFLVVEVYAVPRSNVEHLLLGVAQSSSLFRILWLIQASGHYRRIFLGIPQSRQ